MGILQAWDHPSGCLIVASKPAKTVAFHMRELAARGHTRADELLRLAASYDQALTNLMVPAKNWPNPEMSRNFKQIQNQALALYHECGGEQDVRG